MIEAIEPKFGKYIENINFVKKDRPIDRELKASFLELFNTENLKDREQIWANLKVNINSVSHIPNFANPYFLGFGNPDSNLLFVGKEKAFDIYKSPLSFLHESFNNTLQWKLIRENKFDETNPFDPRNPRKYHNKKIKSIHTWGKYAQIIVGIKGLNLEDKQRHLEELLSEYSHGKDSIFNHCFMTEINHIPARYSNGHNLTEERISHLNNSFYKGFKNVVIGAKGYLDSIEIENIFDAKFKENVELGSKGKLGSKKIEIDIYESDSQQIIYCQQLSGASGWTNKALDKLVAHLK